MVIDDLQNGLFHHLSRDGGQADLLVVSWVFLFALIKDGSNTGLPPVIRHLSHSPWFFRGGGEQQSNKQHLSIPSELTGVSHQVLGIYTC